MNNSCEFPPAFSQELMRALKLKVLGATWVVGRVKGVGVQWIAPVHDLCLRFARLFNAWRLGVEAQGLCKG